MNQEDFVNIYKNFHNRIHELMDNLELVSNLHELYNVTNEILEYSDMVQLNRHLHMEEVEQINYRVVCKKVIEYIIKFTKTEITYKKYNKDLRINEGYNIY